MNLRDIILNAAVDMEYIPTDNQGLKEINVIADNAVNKVLDAAVEAVERTEWQGGDPIEAINKLRGE